MNDAPGTDPNAAGVSELPYRSAALPGIGGRIRARAEHFVVEEVPLYTPSGSGEHVYVTLRRSGRTTRELALGLARVAGIAERDVGYAGLKDRHAVATQTFSLAVRGDERAFAAHAAAELGVELLAVARHGNKLRRGHLIGNRFRLVLTDVEAHALARARAILAHLEQHGLPNFFGVQRIGARGEHARRGERDLALGARPSFASRFALSAFQSELFNRWLVERLARGWFERVLLGDIAKRRHDGALFEVLDETAELERAARGEISATGPIFGATMRAAKGEPGELEAEILRASGATLEDFTKARLEGTRRAARVYPEEWSVAEHPEGLEVAFRLPKGSYATVLARELTRATPLDADESSD